MDISEVAKFREQENKLDSLCAENNMNASFKKYDYPLTMIVTPVQGVENQMSMLENADEKGFTSPDAQLVFKMKDGEITYEMSERFVISDLLFSKLKGIFKKMCILWTGHFHRSIIESKALSEEQMPTDTLPEDVN